MSNPNDKEFAKKLIEELANREDFIELIRAIGNFIEGTNQFTVLNYLKATLPTIVGNHNTEVRKSVFSTSDRSTSKQIFLPTDSEGWDAILDKLKSQLNKVQEHSNKQTPQEAVKKVEIDKTLQNAKYLCDYFLKAQGDGKFHLIRNPTEIKKKDGIITDIPNDNSLKINIKNGKYDATMTNGVYPAFSEGVLFNAHNRLNMDESADKGYGIQFARQMYYLLTNQTPPEKGKLSRSSFSEHIQSNAQRSGLVDLIIKLDNQKSSNPIPLAQVRFELSKIEAQQIHENDATVNAIISMVDKFNNDGKSFFDIGSKAKAERIMKALNKIPVEKWSDIDLKNPNDELSRAIASHRHFWRSSPENNAGSVIEKKAATSFKELKGKLEKIKSMENKNNTSSAEDSNEPKFEI